jgi:DNA-binding MarR family transcriptional regulator/N-acetylglutamate synthase-like GNAT family acetyltransferase
MPTTSEIDRRIDAIRRFNRFYTRQIGALDERHLHSELSLSEARILYEIANTPHPKASAIAEALFLDRGYLSRVLAGFTRRGLVKKNPSAKDRRESELSLTTKGRALFARLDASASRDVGSMLANVPPAAQTKLVEAMSAIQSILGPPAATDPAFTVREHGPGDIGWIIQRHGQIYTEEYGWNAAFEALVAEIAARFLREFDASSERCWIAERNGVNVGCVLLVRRSKTIAQLRLLLVEPSARGFGIGARLVSECVAFARKSGYHKLRLWTNDVLVSARKIYEAAGFTLVDEEAHSTFGKPMTSQTWEMTL